MAQLRKAKRNPQAKPQSRAMCERGKMSTVSFLRKPAASSIAGHVRAREDAAGFRRNETVVGDAENRSEPVAADFHQAYVRHDGPLSRQENFRRVACDARIRHAQFRHFSI